MKNIFHQLFKKCFISLLIVTILLANFLYIPFNQATAQSINDEVKPYLLSGETALPMISVRVSGHTYSLYLITTDPTKVGQIESSFYKRDINYWQSHSITAILAFNESHQLVTEPELLRNIFLTQIGGYIATQNSYDFMFVPIDDQIIHDFSNKSKEPAFITAFFQQETKSLFKLSTQTDKYAEVLRLIISRKDDLGSSFASSVSDKVKMGESWGTAIDEVVKMEKFANNKNVRDAATAAIKYFDNWTTLQTLSAIKGKIGINEISLNNWIDLGDLALNLIFLQQLSPEKAAIFEDLANQARSGQITLSSDLISAIDIVFTEANSPSLQRVDLVANFVSDHLADLSVDLTEDAFRKLVTDYIWQNAGTQITGHLLAGAFSSVFLAFSLADVLYGLDTVYEKMITAENAGKLTGEMNSMLNDLQKNYWMSFRVYPESANVYREVAICWNLSMAQSYASYADAIESSLVVNWIANMIGLNWDQAVSKFKDYDKTGVQQTEGYLINPALVNYAATRPILRISQPGQPSGTVPSSTVLVLDTSGSMSEQDISQKTKLQAAQAAANNILNVIAAEVQSGSGLGSQVGLVDFNNQPRVDTPLSTDITTAQGALQGLSPNGGTGMAAGLQAGLSLFSSVPDANKKMILLLSDGNPNIPLSGTLALDKSTIQQQVVDLATQAGNQGICVYTIGFGVPNAPSTMSATDQSIDEEFLKQVASASRCGVYYNAQDAIQLSNVFVELRHSSMGNMLFKKSGQISQGQQINLGSVDVPANQDMMLFTLNWPGSRLDPIVKDPSGRTVNSNYPGATLSNTSTLVSIILSNPQPGSWNLGVKGADVPEGTTSYMAILSTRQGATTSPGAAPMFGIGIVIVVLAIGGTSLVVVNANRKKKGKGPSSVSYQGTGARMVCLQGENTGQVVLLKDNLTIGRGSACDLQLKDPMISRLHARFRFADGQWFIQDASSAHGTFVNGQLVKATHLKAGDRVQIGANEFEIRF